MYCTQEHPPLQSLGGALPTPCVKVLILKGMYACYSLLQFILFHWLQSLCLLFLAPPSLFTRAIQSYSLLLSATQITHNCICVSVIFTVTECVPDSTTTVRLLCTIQKNKPCVNSALFMNLHFCALVIVEFFPDGCLLEKTNRREEVSWKDRYLIFILVRKYKMESHSL